MAGDSAAETYELNTFDVIRVSTSVILGLGHQQYWRPSRGKYREAVTYRDFYLALGRGDLADAYTRRAIVSNALFWGGFAVQLGGLALGGVGVSRRSVPMAVGGFGAFGAGVAASIVGGGMSAPSVSEEEARALAARYDDLLRDRLGLPRLAPSSSAARLPWTVAFAPTGIFARVRTSF